MGVFFFCSSKNDHTDKSTWSFNYIPLKDFLSVLVFQACVLPDRGKFCNRIMIFTIYSINHNKISIFSIITIVNWLFIKVDIAFHNAILHCTLL